LAGVIAIFRSVYSNLAYQNLVSQCKFAYGYMYEDGQKGKKRGYSFVYEDKDGVLNEHIASVQICKKNVLPIAQGVEHPTVLLIAYNPQQIDIIGKINHGDARYDAVFQKIK